MGKKRRAPSTPDPEQVATPSVPLSGSPNQQASIPDPRDGVVSPMVVNKPASFSKKKVKTAPGRVRRSNRLRSAVKTTTVTEAQETERIIEEITSTDSEKEEEEEEAMEVEEEEEDQQHPVRGEEEVKDVAEEEEEEEEAKEEEDLVPETNGIGDFLEGLVEFCTAQSKTIADMQAQDAQKASGGKRSSAVDMTYKSLYIASKKKVDVLQEENRRLIKELEYARGRNAGLTEALKLSSKSCCCSRPQ